MPNEKDFQPPPPPQPSRSRSTSSEHFRRVGEPPLRHSRSSEDQFNLLYDELRLRAAALLRHEDPSHTLQPTALVHEAFLRLAQQTRAEAQNESQTIGLAVIAMRRALVDHARAKARHKRGGPGVIHLPLDTSHTFAGELPSIDSVDIIALDAALGQLAIVNPRQARMIELRFFGGLTLAQVARAMDVSVGTLESDWRTAREWLVGKLSG